MRSGRIGSAAVVSMRTNRPSRATPATRDPTVMGADPPGGPGFDQAEHDGGHPGGRGDRAGQVEAAVPALRLAQHGAADQEDGQADRDVDEHHPAPGGPLGEQAAGDQADGAAGGGDGGEQADGPHPRRPFGEDGGEQGQGGGGGQRPAHSLQGSGGEQHPAGGGEPAGQRAQGEQGDAGQEGPAPAEQVARIGPRGGAGRRRSARRR